MWTNRDGHGVPDNITSEGGCVTCSQHVDRTATSLVEGAVFMDRNDVERLVNVEQSLQRIEGNTESGFKRIEEKLDNFSENFKEDLGDVRNKSSDHDNRIRTLERWMWSIPPTLIIGLIGLMETLSSMGLF